jgi:gliding motility-associated-like protein
VEFYSCGNEISINANYVSNLNDFKWTRLSDNQVLGYDKALTVKQPQGTEKYELTYTNNCLTSVLLTVHSIPLKVDSLTSKMSLCEGEEFKAQLNIYCAESPDINWYRNGSPVSSGKSPVYTIANATSANSGIYTYTVTNRGCSASGTITASDGKSTLDVSAMPVWNKIPKQTVCEGDSKVVGLYDINPPATQLVWKDDHTIVGPKDQLTATVEPTYNAGNGSGNRSTYKYVIKATNVYCSVEIPIEIDVDEPLNGKIKGADAICEGNPATLDAKSFAASTYSWTSTSFQGSRTTAEITVSPLVTSDYQLTMTRGECSKDMKVTITVNSKPVILLIDSLGPRDREIVPAPGHGTQPLAYGVDNEPVTDDPRKYDLLFAPHTFYIIDAAGCKSKSVEYHVEPPKLFPPAYFTPNGDGYNDTWEIPGMREIYPDATVSIYDRYGKKLVEYKGSADYGWNGRYLGRDMPATDYWYEINIKEINRQYVGHFTLLRR